jgi:hypothetical protein
MAKRNQEELAAKKARTKAKMAAEAKRIQVKQEQRDKEHQQKWAEAQLTVTAIPQTHLRLGLRGEG